MVTTSGREVPALQRMRPATETAADAARMSRGVRRATGWLPRGTSLPLGEWLPRHRWLLGLLWAHAVALPLFALVRGYAPTHVALEGGVIAGIAAAATLAPVSPRKRAAITALGLVTCSALLVHFSGGTIEAHFHFFVVILLLTLYEDWVPFLISLGYVVGHHGVVGTVSPRAVYNHADAIEHPWRWAVIHGAFVAAAGIGAVVAWRLNEISRARAAEAVADAVRSHEAAELKNKFIAMTSHELRTPLTSIGGFATTLIHRWEQIDDSNKRQLLEIIAAQSGRLQNLIDSLLLLSTADSGKLRVRPALVDVRGTVDQVVHALGGPRGVVVDIEAGVRAHVDEQHFTQIVLNYVTNAQKYGSPPIVVSAARTDGWFELEVADAGTGVPAEFLPHLFEPFARIDDAAGAGSGLGLSIVRGLAEAHGGEATYEPNSPRGSRFKVRFPQQTSVPEPAPA